MSKYDVYLPEVTSSVPPSATQKRIIGEMRDGAKLIGTFDIWGYDWKLIRSNGMVSRVARTTMQGLLDRALIARGEEIRHSGGHREIAFLLK